MRKKDREITDREEAIRFLSACDTIRLGIFGEDYPYVVPVSFGFADNGSALTLYFHGAKVGKKYELLKKDGRVCVEADGFFGYAELSDGVTADYQSFIGFGTVEECSGEEKLKGLDLIMKHCGFGGFGDKQCPMLEQTYLGKISLERFSCKKRFK